MNPNLKKRTVPYGYKCKEEIAAVAHCLNISDFVIVMETDHLPNEEEMEDYFKISF